MAQSYKSFKILLFSIFVSFSLYSCGDSTIIESTSGDISYDSPIEIVFDSNVIKDIGKIYTASDEIKINDEADSVLYVFTHKNILKIIPKNISPDTELNIKIDFQKINKIASSTIKDKSKKINLHINPIKLDIKYLDIAYIDNAYKIIGAFSTNYDINIDTLKKHININQPNISLDILKTDKLLYKIISSQINPSNNIILSFDKELGISKNIDFEIKKSTQELKILNAKSEIGTKASIKLTLNDTLSSKDTLSHHIRITPEVANLSINTAKNLINIKGNFTHGETYQVTLLSSLKTQKFKLDKDISTQVEIKETTPKILFVNDGVYLPSSQNKTIAFKSINVKEVNIAVKKIHENNIGFFLNDRDLLKVNTNDFYIYDFYKLGDEISNRKIQINSAQNVWTQTSIDLSHIKDTSGIFLIELSYDEKGIDYVFPSSMTSWQKDSFLRENGRATKQVIFSNIGLIAHKYRDKDSYKLHIKALSLLDNAPLQNVKIDALSSTNQILSSVMTDKDGKTDIELGDDSKIFYLLAKRDKDMSILKLESSILSDDGFATQGIASTNGINAYIYTDRSVYRPGENIHINILAKHFDKDKLQNIKYPIRLNVISPKQNKVLDIQLDSSGEGMYYHNLKTDTQENGIYEIKVNIGDSVFSHQVLVENIIPNRIKADIISQNTLDLHKDKNLSFQLKSNYLFGEPSSRLKYDVLVSFSPIYFSSPIYKEWIFHSDTNTNYYEKRELKGILDENGISNNSLSLDNIGINANTNINANMIVNIYENNGRILKQNKNIIINKYDSFVGIKRPSNIYIKNGEKTTLPIILIDQDSKPIKDRILKYNIYANSYSWWIDYNDRNTFLQNLKSDKNTILLKSGELKSKNEAINLEFVAKTEGEILVEVIDISNSQTSQIALHSSTFGEKISINKLSRVDIKTDKDIYKDGDKATLSFESLKNQKAYIVLSQGEEILSKEYIDTTEKMTSYDFKIKSSFAPNIYASVFLLQDYNTKQNDRAMRLYGVVPINVVNQNTKLDINIDMPKTIRPNTPLSIKISNSQKMPSMYTLSLVDEGLLNLTNLNMTKAYEYFYAKQKLGIINYDSYEYIIDKLASKSDATYSIGGDRMFALSSPIKSPIQNNTSRFKPIAFAIPPTKSDKDGNAIIKFDIPNYIGSLKAMVVGSADSLVGSSEKNILVTSPLIMLPTIPRNLKNQDRFKLAVEIISMDKTSDSKEVEVSIKSKGLITFSPSLHKIKLNAKSTTIIFDAILSQKIGIEDIELTLKSKDITIKDNTQIQISSKTPYTQISNNLILEPNKTINIKAPISSIQNSSKGVITLSSTPKLNIHHRLSYLIRYPYGCIEQSTSSVFPQLFLDIFGSNISKQTSIDNINSAIAKISKHQTNDGGFAYWLGQSKSDKFGSFYAGHFLSIAKKYGYTINDNVHKKWLNYLRKNIDDKDIYPLFLLALNDIYELGALNNIYEKHLAKLSNTNRWLLAASYKLAGFDDIALKITSNLSLIPNENTTFLESSYGSVLRNKAIILYAYFIIHQKPDSALLNEILLALQSDDRLSTQEIGFGLLALASVSSPNPKDSTNLKATITLDGKKQKLDSKNPSFALNEGSASISSPNRIFVNYFWEGISEDKSLENISNNLEINRDFVVFDDNAIKRSINVENIKNATSFYIELKLKNLSDNKISHIALSQGLPSGWEIENQRLNNDTLPNIVSRSNSNMEYMDIRDDAMMWFFTLDAHEEKVAYIKINAITPGTYTLPPADAQDMYSDRYKATSSSLRVRVNEK